MKMILAGGGNAQQSKAVDEFFLQFLPRKRFLFIPHAISPKLWKHEKALEWIHKPKSFENIDIAMWKDIHRKTADDLEEFDALYLMGGNTYELLYQLRSSDFLTVIRDFLGKGKMVYGISAGAYVLGKDIQDRIPPEDEDKNSIGLQDLSALNLVKNHNVHCHYIPEHDNLLFEFEKRTQIPLVAIPETSGVFVDGDHCHSLGSAPVYIFQKNGQKIEIAPNTEFSLKE